MVETPIAKFFGAKPESFSSYFTHFVSATGSAATCAQVDAFCGPVTDRAFVLCDSV